MDDLKTCSYQLTLPNGPYRVDVAGRMYDSTIDFRFYRSDVEEYTKEWVHRLEVKGTFREFQGITFESESDLLAFLTKEGPLAFGTMVSGIYIGAKKMGGNYFRFTPPDPQGLVEVPGGRQWNDEYYPESER